MGHKRESKKDNTKNEKLDLRICESELEGLKESVKQLKKIRKRKEEITKLERKKKKMLKEIKKGIK